MEVKEAQPEAAPAGDKAAAPAPTPEAEAEAEERRKQEAAAKAKQEEEREAAERAAAAPQPAAATGPCTLQLADGAAPRAFDGCRRINLGETQMNLLWSSAPVAGNPAVRAAVRLPRAYGVGGGEGGGEGGGRSRAAGPARDGRLLPGLRTEVTPSCVAAACPSTAACPLGSTHPSHRKATHPPFRLRCLPQKTALTLGLNATSAFGYVALGFPARPGRMTGATAFILAPSTGAATGAQLGQYYLGGEQQSGEAPVWGVLPCGVVLCEAGAAV